MTKKNKTALAVLCVVLALCVAALLFLILLPKGGEKQSPVVSFSSVYSMTFDGGTGTEYEYVNDGGVWRCALDSSIPLNQAVFDRIATYSRKANKSNAIHTRATTNKAAVSNKNILKMYCKPPLVTTT